MKAKTPESKKQPYKMRIFRIENSEGQGCMLCHTRSHPLCFDLSHNMPDGSERLQHPDADIGTELHKAYFDKKIHPKSPLKFGFATIKDIYTWFCPATIGLFEHSGFFIHMYEIDDRHVIKGTRQVAFDPSNATKKEKISHKLLRHLDC
jgi:hypothetical protein